VYGPDRNFVSVFLLGDEPAETAMLPELERAGHPVARVQVDDLHLIGQEFFRWEVAVAAAGSILGVHPFNEPDVQAAKEFARQAMESRGAGAFGAGTQRGQPAPGADVGATAADRSGPLAEAIGRWLESARRGDYIAVQAYLPHDDSTQGALQAIRVALRDRTRLATTLGYGPRFLHSTGQIHKGGPNNGLFLQIVDEPADDIPIPDAGHSFGDLVRAQALGDAVALVRRGRRVVRVDLGRGGGEGLMKILDAVKA
jgi:transaldolase/glucose-6-phosphate isomerase